MHLQQRRSSAGRLALLAFAVVGAPAAWTLHLVAVYIASHHFCDMGIGWALHGFTLIAASQAVLALVVAVAWYRRLDDESERDQPMTDVNDRFLLSTGLLFGGLFLLGIALNELGIILEGCG
ncbi:MAG: hypothetical protein WD058_02545 [Dehalococcoidia bacterium]